MVPFDTKSTSEHAAFGPGLVLWFSTILLLTATTLSAQDTKGARPVNQPNNQPINQSTNPPIHQTRAVVVGISDYQWNDIPDLKYAHKDAEAFAAWLQSPAGGNVPEENILLLTEKLATNAAFSDALDWLVATCSEGEQAIIYFSGHGDVETKTFNQLGFLLLQDSPARSYKAGAYSLLYLQDIISTLSLLNKARVTVITDACHAGKLAGTSIGGTVATAENLAKQFSNEVKILSCQPTELSHEGEQWGGGRGVFSWHLIDGLTGLADKNADRSVNLFEIRRYLEDAVPADMAPLAQTPMAVGDLQTTLSRVDAAALAALQTDKESRKNKIATTGSKGFEDVWPAGLSDADSIRYAEFKKAIENRELLDASPGNRSADELYRELSGNPSLASLHNLMRRNLAVALQDEVQQALNALLDNDPYEANTWNFNPEKYGRYPAYLARTIELLGDKHYMARDLRAKQLFFEGYNLSKRVGELENEPLRRDSVRNEAKALFLQSFTLDNEAAYVPYSIGELYIFRNQTDSVLTWYSRAIERSPGWLMPYINIAYEVAQTNSAFTQANDWIARALEQDSTSYLALERLSWLMQWQFRPEEAIVLCDKMIALRPDLFNAYTTKAYTLYWLQGEYHEAEQYCLHSLVLNPMQCSFSTWLLGLIYLDTRRVEEAVQLYQRSLASGNCSVNDQGYLYPDLLRALVVLGRYEEAEQAFAKANAVGFDHAGHVTAIQANAGRMWLQRGNLYRADSVLRHALSIDSTLDNLWIQINADLGVVQMRLGKAAEAEAFFQKAVTQEKMWVDLPLREEAHLLYGNFLLGQKRIADARAQFDKCHEYRPNGWRWRYGYALLAAREGKTEAALDWLEQALDKYLTRKEIILEEPLFKKLRKTARFKALIKKHFPDNVKD